MIKRMGLKVLTAIVAATMVMSGASMCAMAAESNVGATQQDTNLNAILQQFVLQNRALYEQAFLAGDTTYFDVDAYLAANPDLAALVGDNKALALQHYLSCGIFEMRESGSQVDAMKMIVSHPEIATGGSLNLNSVVESFVAKEGTANTNAIKIIANNGTVAVARAVASTNSASNNSTKTSSSSNSSSHKKHSSSSDDSTSGSHEFTKSQHYTDEDFVYYEDKNINWWGDFDVTTEDDFVYTYAKYLAYKEDGVYYGIDKIYVATGSSVASVNSTLSTMFQDKELKYLKAEMGGNHYPRYNIQDVSEISIEDLGSSYLWVTPSAGGHHEFDEKEILELVFTDDSSKINTYERYNKTITEDALMEFANKWNEYADANKNQSLASEPALMSLSLDDEELEAYSEESENQTSEESETLGATETQSDETGESSETEQHSESDDSGESGEESGESHSDSSQTDNENSGSGESQDSGSDEGTQEE